MIVDGKLVASRIKQKISQKLAGQNQKRVCFVIFGNDPSSKQYIAMKCRFAESLGIIAEVSEHSDSLTNKEIEKTVQGVVSQNYDGVVIQLPLPTGISTQDILNLIPVEIDIDVLSDKAKEIYKNGNSSKIPPVASAVFEILDFYDIELIGKEILVIGAGKLVGEPVCNMLELKKIPFNVIDKNSDIEVQKELIAGADIIISGAGSPHFIKPNMLKNNVVIIDAGTSEQNGKVVGDVDPRCADNAILLTPVPNGVGPVTIASLFLNI